MIKFDKIEKYKDCIVILLLYLVRKPNNFPNSASKKNSNGIGMTFSFNSEGNYNHQLEVEVATVNS